MRFMGGHTPPHSGTPRCFNKPACNYEYKVGWTGSIGHTYMDMGILVRISGRFSRRPLNFYVHRRDVLWVFTGGQNGKVRKVSANRSLAERTYAIYFNTSLKLKK